MLKKNRSQHENLSYFKYVRKELYGLVLIIIFIIASVCVFFAYRNDFTINGWGSLISGVISLLGAFVLGSVNLYQSKLFSLYKHDFERYQRRIFEPKVRIESFNKLENNSDINIIDLNEYLKEKGKLATKDIVFHNKILYVPIIIHNYSDFNIQFKHIIFQNSQAFVVFAQESENVIAQNEELIVIIGIKRKIYNRLHLLVFNVIYESYNDGYTYKKRYRLVFQNTNMQHKNMNVMALEEEII